MFRAAPGCALAFVFAILFATWAGSAEPAGQGERAGQPAQTGVARCDSAASCAPALAEASGDETAAGRAQLEALIKAMARFGDGAVDPLRGLLRDERPMVRRAAARALGQLSERARPAVSDLIEALEHGTTEAAPALAASGDPRAVPALQAEFSRSASAVAARGLTRLGRAGFLALAEVMGDPALNERVASVALEAFREGGDGIDAAAEKLGQFLERPDRPSFVRAYTAACLGETGAAGLEHAQPLRDLLKDPSPLVQQAALDALSQLGDGTLAPVLLERTGAPDWSTRFAAFTGLAHLGPAAKPVEPQLIALLGSPDFEPRGLAAEVLGWMRDPRAVPPLVSALHGNSWSASEQAARALARLGAKSALPELKRIAKEHWSHRVRRAASEAAAEIQKGSVRPSARHDFHDVNSARRVQAAQSERSACPGKAETGWRVQRDAQQVTVRPSSGGDDAPAVLPTVLPPVRLGRDDGFKEHTRGRSVQDGWLIAKDAGEWGGALWFVGWDGHKAKLADQPLDGFVELHGRLLGVGALPHRSRSAGALWKFERGADGQWRADPLLELPGAPLGWEVLKDGALVVATEMGAVDLSSDGRVRELACGR